MTYVLLVVMILWTFSGIAMAKEMSIKEFISYCQKIKIILFKIQVTDKSGKIFNRALLNNLEKLDSSFRIHDDKGNFIEFNWEREIESLKSSITKENPSKTEVATNLNQFLSRIQDDVDIARKIPNSRNQILKKEIDKAVRETIPGESSGIIVIQPGSEVSNRLSEENLKQTMNFLQRIMDFLSRISNWINERMGGRSFIPPTTKMNSIDWVIAVLIVIVLVFFFINIFPLLRLGRRVKSEPDGNGENFILISLGKAIEAAENHARAGNYSLALKELLRGLFMGLDEKELIPYRVSRTNREYRYAIPRRAPEYAVLAREFLPFMDDVLYGGRRTAAENYLKYKKELEAAFNSRSH